MFKFIYNKEKDIECWNRLVTAGVMFGQKFPKDFDISKDMELKAEDKAVIFQKQWDKWFAENDFDEGIRKVFGHSFPEGVSCYINTSRYSMDCYPEYISISMDRENIVTSLLHEVNHYMFRKYFSDVENIEEIKEIITIINNDVFGVQDFGWKIHQEARKKTLRVWKVNKDLQEVISSLKKIK